MKEQTLIRTKDVVSMTGASFRQLQWWDETGLLSVPIDGHTRSYREEDIATIRVIAQLRKKGLSLQKVRRILTYLRRTTARQYLVTDGRTHATVDGKERVVAILLEAKRPMFVVDLAAAGATIR